MSAKIRGGRRDQLVLKTPVLKPTVGTRRRELGANVAEQRTDSPPLVLVVDDFQDNREMFAEFLSLSGYRVAEAATGREAIDRGFELLPDVILMDLSLPSSTDGRRRVSSRTIRARSTSPSSRSRGTRSPTTRAKRARPAVTPSSPSPACPRCSSWRSGECSTGARASAPRPDERTGSGGWKIDGAGARKRSPTALASTLKSPLG